MVVAATFVEVVVVVGMETEEGLAVEGEAVALLGNEGDD